MDRFSWSLTTSCFLLLAIGDWPITKASYHGGSNEVVPTVQAESVSCGPWLLWNQANAKCECSKFKFKGIIRCEDNSASVLDCYCATTEGNVTVAGSCFYNCENNDKVMRDILYHDISVDVCAPFNRTGILCGKCQNDTYPLAYSFDLSCVECEDDRGNWIAFFILATVPSTFFFFVVIIFRINITSSYLHGFVFFSQGISFPANMRIILRAVHSNHVAEKSAEVIASLYGFWNLDFFRPLLPRICLKLTTLQVLSLDYIIAAYPLLLIILSYIVVTLYYRNFRVIVWVTHPLRSLFARFQRTWNIKTSIMDAYATFFVLSYTKFLSASFDLLMPTYVCSSVTGKKTISSYYDANLEYFKGPHLPLALTALAVLIVFVIIPTLTLLLYSFRFSQVVLTKLHLQSSFLDLFVNPFYRCYKDGTEPNTRDCRWFSSFFFILRIILPLVYSFTLGSVFLPLAVIIIFIFVMILITVKPYKPAYSHFIKFDVTFLLLLALFYLSMISIDVSSIKDHRLVRASYYLTIVFGVVPLLYVVLVVLYWIISKRNHGPELIRRFLAFWRFQHFRQESMEYDEVPDRLLHPSEYLNASASLKASASVRQFTGETY